MELECHRAIVENLKEIELIAEAADAAFQNTGPNGRTQGNAMTRAALVLLCGYFEGFIREVVEEYIDIINDGDIHLNKFPEQLFCAVIDDLAYSLQRESANASNMVNAVNDFKTSLQPAGIVKIKKKNFSKTGGNPTVDTIENVFNNLGIPNIIDILSIRDFAIDSTFTNESQVPQNMRSEIKNLLHNDSPTSQDETLQEIIKIIEIRWIPKQKRRKVGYVNEIEQLLKKRNRIAHGEGREQITPTELREFSACIKKLTDGFHLILTESLRNLIQD